MFTLETCGATNVSNFCSAAGFYLGHASLVKLMRYHFKSHVTTKRPAKEFGCCWHPDNQRKQHCILGVAWGGFFPPVNIAFHRINTAFRVKIAIHANFTGTSR